MQNSNPWLLIGGALSAAASLAHLAVIVGGPRWYAAFGAGKRMVRLAEQGAPSATLITLGIAAVLAVWAAYAFSGAGLLPRLPLLRLGLVAISAVYLIRALVFVPAVMLQTGQAGTFAWVSSAIVLVFGLAYAIGTWTTWGTLR
ncbi:MAG: hypothetical protein PSV23_11445 [Brevundimonas sp.]|uniref:hypothetical protein n=1 Tax=Brevundimonas sp. TaxID=1871086 RepID=UPI0024890641|nr:hypothetical protein [Brevundimonas sp.]MDI1327400.1 hypothetical protein [Brevundimonas sp.]